ncbi:MAG: alpha/beta hydrolase [Pseudomonadales bacterium]|jgi:pimeloyl-ACP methyl ester carboxylesterase
MAYVNHNGAKLYYQVIGDGSAITFAHGAGGNAASWYQQVPFFCKNYKTITFDHRAFARSDCKEEDYHSSKFADDLAAILDDAGIEKTALVCQSLGGWTGISFSLKYPERVSALVMSHTTGGITNNKITDSMKAAASDRQPASEPFGSWAIAADLPEKDPVKANLYNQLGNFNVTINLEKILSGIGGTRSGTTEEDLKGFSIPTLFVTASMDVLMPPAAIAEASRLIEGSELKSFEGIGHSSYFECPDEFNSIVAEFLARRSA